MIYTDFSLSTGENSGGVNYTAPDRIVWNNETWRVIRVRYWAMFGVNQCIAVRVRDG